MKGLNLSIYTSPNNMNKLKLLAAALLALCFTACITINEEVSINNNGTGNMRIHSDMGKMFEMLKSFAGEEEIKKEGMDKKMDTTIFMKDIVDTAKNMSAEDKALLRDGALKLKMNMQENLFDVDMNYPFKNLNDANKLYAAMNKGGGLASLMKGFNQGDQGGDNSAGGIDKIGTLYDIRIKDGEYSRTLNQARYDSLMTDPRMQESKGMMGMMGDMGMNLLVKLPRAAKSVSNPKAVLSDDKKSVTLPGDIMIALDSPKTLEIVIRY